jgi:hypothetical protein
MQTLALVAHQNNYDLYFRSGEAELSWRNSAPDYRIWTDLLSKSANADLGAFPSRTAQTSPAVRRRARARARANVAAKRRMNRRTAAAGVGEHVVKRRGMGRAIMPGHGRCRERACENNRSGKRNFCLAEHFDISRLSFAIYSRLKTRVR